MVKTESTVSLSPKPPDSLDTKTVILGVVGSLLPPSVSLLVLLCDFSESELSLGNTETINKTTDLGSGRPVTSFFSQD